MGSGESFDGLEGLKGEDASQLAKLMAEASDEQLAAGMTDPAARRLVLDEIFGRLADHVDAEAIAEVDAVIHFKITDGPDGGHDIYEAVFRDGTVLVADRPSGAEPRVTIVAPPVPFLRLVSGRDSGPALLMTGKLKITGDLLFAARMTSFFKVPRAG